MYVCDTNTYVYVVLISIQPVLQYVLFTIHSLINKYVVHVTILSIVLIFYYYSI